MSGIGGFGFENLAVSSYAGPAAALGQAVVSAASPSGALLGSGGGFGGSRIGIAGLPGGGGGGVSSGNCLGTGLFTIRGGLLAVGSPPMYLALGSIADSVLFGNPSIVLLAGGGSFCTAARFAVEGSATPSRALTDLFLGTSCLSRPV